MLHMVDQRPHLYRYWSAALRALDRPPPCAVLLTTNVLPRAEPEECACLAIVEGFMTNPHVAEDAKSTSTVCQPMPAWRGGRPVILPVRPVNTSSSETAGSLRICYQMFPSVGPNASVRLERSHTV
jgi:hypothetical protein